MDNLHAELVKDIMLERVQMTPILYAAKNEIEALRDKIAKLEQPPVKVNGRKASEDEK